MSRTHVCRLRCQDHGFRHRPFLDLWHLSSLWCTHPRFFSSVPRYRFPYLYKACVNRDAPNHVFSGGRGTSSPYIQRAAMKL